MSSVIRQGHQALLKYQGPVVLLLPQSVHIETWHRRCTQFTKILHRHEMLERNPKKNGTRSFKNIERTEELLQESEELRQCSNQIFRVNLWSLRINAIRTYLT